MAGEIATEEQRGREGMTVKGRRNGKGKGGGSYYRGATCRGK